MSQRFRKKPVEVDAVQWKGTNIREVLDFCYADKRWQEGIESEYVNGPGIGHVPPLGTLDIPTLEGTMTASAGDWIIRDVRGELYPCKPDVFEATYDSAEEKPERIFDWTTDTDIETAVFEALGAASVCWGNLEGAGIFDSTRAKQIADELIEYFQSKQPIY